MSSVAVFRSQFLPTSETFIADHITSMRRFNPVAICEQDVNSPSKPDVDVINVGGRINRVLLRKLGFSAKLQASIRKRELKLVHAHFLNDADRIVTFCKRQRLPLIVTAHGYDATRFDQNHKSRLRTDLIEFSRKIICVSDFIRDSLIEAGYPKQKLITVPLGVDLRSINPGPLAGRKGILSIARLVEKKGTDYLIRAYAALPEDLRREHPLTIIGDGPLRQSLEELARSLQVEVSFLGSQKRDVGLGLLQTSRLFCLPSVRAEDGDAEGMPIVLMEAMASGAPTVFFDTQHMSGAIARDEAAFIVDYKSIPALTDAILEGLTSDSTWQHVSDGGRRFAERNFDVFKNTGHIEQIYAEEIGR